MRDRLTKSTAVILPAALLIGLIPFFFLFPMPLSTVVTAGIGVLFVLSVVSHDQYALHLTLLGSLLAVYHILVQSHVWPDLLIPLGAYGLLVIISPLRKSVPWFIKGAFDGPVRMLAVAAVVLSSSALAVWYIIAKPDLGPSLRSVMSWSPTLLIFEGIGFALLNAGMEELLFRGVVMGSLEGALDAGALSLVLQAVIFGLFHIRGIPGGWVGIILAAIYGLMLGMIRRRSGGLLAPFVTHVFADMVIFGLLVAAHG